MLCPASFPARSLFLAAVAALVHGCASAPPPGSLRESVHSLEGQQRFEAALDRNHQLLVTDGTNPTPEDFAHHVTLLRKVGREVEASALARWLAPRGTTTTIDVSECEERRAFTRQRGELVWLPRNPRAFSDQRFAVRYAVNKDGTLHDVEVLEAASRVVAWKLIHALGRARVAHYRTNRYEDEQFPVEHCAFDWGRPKEHRSWRPPRVRNNW